MRMRREGFREEVMVGDVKGSAGWDGLKRIGRHELFLDQIRTVLLQALSFSLSVSLALLESPSPSTIY